MTDKDRNVEKLEKLIKDFEDKALDLGYTLEACSLYDKEYDRYQINWNDKAEDWEIRSACQSIAMSLWMMAKEDKEIVKDALYRSHFYTQEGKKDLADLFSTTLAKGLSAGVELGKNILEEKKETFLKLEGGKDEPE